MVEISIEVTVTEKKAADNGRGKDHEFREMKYEYPGYTGPKMWFLYATLPEQQLQKMYPEEFAEHTPYIYMDPEQSQAVRDYRLNEHKNEMRDIRKHDVYGYEDGTTEIFHNEIGTADILDDLILAGENITMRQQIESAIGEMTEVQKRRFTRHFFDGLSMREIAAEEGAHYTTVQESIDGAVKKFRKYF